VSLATGCRKVQELETGVALRDRSNGATTGAGKRVNVKWQKGPRKDHNADRPIPNINSQGGKKGGGGRAFFLGLEVETLKEKNSNDKLSKEGKSGRSLKRGVLDGNLSLEIVGGKKGINSRVCLKGGSLLLGKRSLKGGGEA